MIYAKLYPGQLIKEYSQDRASVSIALLNGPKNPTAEESAAFGEPQPRLHGDAPACFAHRRAVSEGINLPWLCACTAEEKCGADLSTHAGQPRAQPGGCAQSQRTCGQIAARAILRQRFYKLALSESGCISGKFVGNLSPTDSGRIARHSGRTTGTSDGFTFSARPATSGFRAGSISAKN